MEHKVDLYGVRLDAVHEAVLKLPIPRGVVDDLLSVVDPVGGEIPISLRYCHVYSVRNSRHNRWYRFNFRTGPGPDHQGPSTSPTRSWGSLRRAWRIPYRIGGRTHHTAGGVRAPRESRYGSGNEYRSAPCGPSIKYIMPALPQQRRGIWQWLAQMVFRFIHSTCRQYKSVI
jgi:hypothetical protein